MPRPHQTTVGKDGSPSTAKTGRAAHRGVVDAPVIASLPIGRSSQPREYPRYSLTIPVLLQLHDGREIVGTTQDFGSGGFRAALNCPLEISTPLTLTCALAEVCYLTLAGQVVTCDPAVDQSDPCVVSVKFSAVRDWEVQILESAVQALTEDASTVAKSLLTIGIAKDTMALEAGDWYARMPELKKETPHPVRQSCVHASKIIGWGAYLPPNKVTNEDVNEFLRVEGEKTRFGDVIGTVTGIRSRRYASSRYYPSDLAAEASKIALKNAGVDPKDLEVIISCGVTRDVEEPATAYIIQEKLGAKNAYCFDLANACNGFLSALDVLDSFIASGRCELGLVAVGDTLSQFVTWAPHSKKDLHRSSMGYTFGDGGGAAVVQRVSADDHRGMRARWFLSDGACWKVAVIPLMNVDTDKRLFKSNGMLIERIASYYIPIGIRETLKALQWDVDDIDVVIPHQVGLHVVTEILYKGFGIPPEKVAWPFPECGNVGAASMPVAVYSALQEGRLKQGDRVLFVGGSGGFGAGIMGLVF